MIERISWLAMGACRSLAYLLIACAGVWVASYRSIWYDNHVIARKSPTFEFDFLSSPIPGKYARILVFFSIPWILAAVCGACWEAAWFQQQLRRVRRPGVPRSVGGSSHAEFDGGHRERRAPWIGRLLQLNFRPLGKASPWITVGEAVALLCYVLVLTLMVYHGVDYKMQGANGELLTMLKNIAKYMGFAAIINFSVLLVPVSRDSKIWSAIGVPVERAVLYHTALGHLSFITLFLHGFLYMLYYVLKHGWRYAIDRALHYDGSSVNVPAGSLAGLCAIPMWVASLEWVRRRHYNRFFKPVHFLFIGVFAFGLAHYGAFGYYLLGGISLYMEQMTSRMGNWTRLRQWVCWIFRPVQRCGSLVHLHTESEYTRLVLRNPRKSKAKGSMLVYLSAPSLRGTIEAHPMSVALRGPPPPLRQEAGCDDGVFTVYVKVLGAWTEALRKQDSNTLLIDVDGFYGGVTTLMSMKSEGYPRVVLFAGGSGVTSFLALIQDWCAALRSGEDVPEVHLVWSCQRVTEMELVGEALPSMLASAGAGADIRFKMSLFCTGKEREGPLSVAWPVVEPLEESVGHHRGICAHTVFESLNGGIRTVITGAGAFAGWILGEEKFEEGVLKGFFTLLCMVVASAGTLVLYTWATVLAHILWTKKGLCAPAWKRYHALREANGPEDACEETSLSREMGSTTSQAVSAGRPPVYDMLLAEQALAERNGFKTVKVLVSGPRGMVDSVMSETRIVSWKLFDAEDYSREF